jgi:hypothetical protein
MGSRNHLRRSTLATWGGQGAIDRIGNNLQSFQLDRTFLGVQSEVLTALQELQVSCIGALLNCLGRQRWS